MRLALLIAVALPVISSAAECTARSGPNTAALVELYTSEGCSSCPPADRWLSRFRTVAGNGEVVALAYHVNYWDYIGWKDMYAEERHTQRQRKLAAVSGARYVYTPQVVLGGRDFRGWSSHRSASHALEAINRTPARADIELRARPLENGRLIAEAIATLKPGERAKDLALVVAATQSGLSSRVTSGENRGEKLQHDFVVRDLVEMRSFTASPKPRAAATVTFAARADWKPESMALAAFVQDTKTGEVLQALSLPLCR